MPVKGGELFQKKAVKGSFCNTDVDGAVLITQGTADVFLTLEDLLAGGSDILIELFPFRGQGYATLGPDKKPADKLCLEGLHAAGNGRLAGKQCLGGQGKILVFYYIIKDFIIFKICCHESSFYKVFLLWV